MKPPMLSLMVALSTTYVFAQAAPTIAAEQPATPGARKTMYPDLTWPEIVEHLKTSDVIFVPIGVVEIHGGLPLGIEYYAPLAVAKVMAEKTGGLVFPHIANSFAGATKMGEGTINLPIRVGADYTKAIVHELRRNGFERIVLLTYHGPAPLTGALVAREVYEETGMPILYIDLAEYRFEGDFWLGALKLLGKL